MKRNDGKTMLNVCKKIPKLLPKFHKSHPPIFNIILKISPYIFLPSYTKNIIYSQVYVLPDDPFQHHKGLFQNMYLMNLFTITSTQVSRKSKKIVLKGSAGGLLADRLEQHVSDPVSRRPFDLFILVTEPVGFNSSPFRLRDLSCHVSQTVLK